MWPGTTKEWIWTSAGKTRTPYCLKASGRVKEIPLLKKKFGIIRAEFAAQKNLYIPSSAVDTHISSPYFNIFIFLFTLKLFLPVFSFFFLFFLVLARFTPAPNPACLCPPVPPHLFPSPPPDGFLPGKGRSSPVKLSSQIWTEIRSPKTPHVLGLP